MKHEFYFTLTLTEAEHDIVKSEMEAFCNAHPDIKLVYYRKFKNGHVPTQREIRIKGDIRRLREFLKSKNLKAENYWRKARREIEAAKKAAGLQ